MENFTFYSPTYFAFGNGEENHTGSYIKRFGGSRVLIHYGGGSVVRSGLLDRVKKSLEEEDISYVELGGVKPNPRSGLVYEGIELCRKEHVDFVLAVGGGSTIDSAKAIAAGSVYDGDFWDYYQGKKVEKALPVGTVLTIAAAGSEGSPDSVITKAHLFERYFTNTENVEVTDRLIEGLLLSVIHEAPKVIADPDDYQARANILWAGMMAHNNSCGVGREQDWGSHDIEHELSAVYDCTHGAGLAMVVPAWMTYNLKHDVNRFVQLAVRVWGCQMDFQNPEVTARAGIRALKNFLRSIGMPLNFGEIGAKEEDIKKMAHTACYGNGRKGTVGKFVRLGEEDVEKIYRLML